MKYRLKDVYKQEMFDNEQKRARNVIKNFMVQQQVPLVSSSSMIPIYKRTEFMGLLLLLILITWLATLEMNGV